VREGGGRWEKSTYLKLDEGVWHAILVAANLDEALTICIEHHVAGFFEFLFSLRVAETGEC
jgi:hypothetical protein